MYWDAETPVFTTQCNRYGLQAGRGVAECWSRSTASRWQDIERLVEGGDVFAIRLDMAARMRAGNAVPGSLKEAACVGFGAPFGASQNRNPIEG